MLAPCEGARGRWHHRRLPRRSQQGTRRARPDRFHRAEGRGALARDLSRIEQALLAIPAIVACYLVSGSIDFLVEAAVPDLAGYEQLLLGQILTIPSVVEAQSTFAIRTILSRGPLPLDHWRG
ncbi:MAG TPA: Lrp/AsnC ligand binding domain-containing protein [Streptosporangiaceae bacterium]|nr:Lrp/AsnC ligand binding domain-containing protein [Streptosporangiaceae bacterium]